MTRIRIFPLVLLLSCPALAAAEPALAAAEPALAASEEIPDASLAATAYTAPTQALTTLSGLKAYVERAVDSPWDVEKAARVENLVFEKDEGKWTLTGWIYLRTPVDGVTYQAQFYGDGRFEMTPPIKMEKDQVRRFLGRPSVDMPIKSMRMTFTGADDQQFFEGLKFTAADAQACEAGNDECKKALKAWREWMAKGETSEAASRRRYAEFPIAAGAYERFLDPGMEGSFTGRMDVKVPEGTDKSKSYLVGLEFDYDPANIEEVRLVGTWDHGKRKPSSIISRFHAKGQYDATSDRTASSAFAETESKGDVSVRKNTFRMKFDPGGKRDLRMRADMDCVITGDEVRHLLFYIVGFMGVTRAEVDGAEVEFHQPKIPGQDWLHAPYIIVAVPRTFKKGEELRVSMDLEGKILQNVNGTTWMVKEEDNWFPTPTVTLGNDISPMFETTLLTPKAFTAIANGRESACEPSDAEPGMECVKYVTNTPIDFATFNIGRDFRVDKGESMNEDADRDGKPDPKVPIRVYTNATAKTEFVWVDPENPALVQKRSYSLSENGADAVGKAQIARRVYTEWFGPCPYDTLMITPHPKGHGRGSASLLLVSQEAFLSSTAQAEWASLSGRPYNPYNTTAFLVHEIAHQWWGGAVRIRGDRDQWFSEGFSDYAAAIVLEELDKVNDTKWFWGKLAELRDHVLKDDGYANDVTPLCLGNRFASSQNRSGYTGGLARQNFMYSKGAYVMHMLRMLARAKEGDPQQGDELFKKVMHDFVNWCLDTGRAPSNVDMQNSFEKSFGMKMDYFFDQWIYGMGVPKVEWSYQVVPTDDGGFAVKGRVRQKDTDFQFPLAVSFYDGAKELGFGYTWIARQDTEFTIPLDFKPQKVAVNTEFGVLGLFKEVPWSAASAAGQ